MQNTVTTEIRPILKWAGNKFQTPVAARVKELFEPYRESHYWTEPFLGVGGMLLDVNPPFAWCCDASPEVVGLHRWIQDGGKCVEFPEVWDEPDYYQRRAKFNLMQQGFIEDPDEFYSLMIWLNKTCYNGLWRVNAKGMFNVPIGRDSKGELHVATTPDLRPLHKAYNPGWRLHHLSCFLCLTSVAAAEIDCFVYSDPPYWGTHSAYTAKPFTWDDQVCLARQLGRLSCPVVASNSNHPDILDLYDGSGFKIELIEVPRSISCNGNRKPAVEMLAYKGVEV